MSIQKSELTLKENGKPLNAYLASPPGGGPGVLVLPSWWGLKPFFKQVCDRLAEQGYTALAPDYYQGRVANTIDEAKALQEEAERDFDAMQALVKAAKDHLAALRAIPNLVVIRPADANEVREAWKVAVERRHGHRSADRRRREISLKE